MRYVYNAKAYLGTLYLQTQPYASTKALIRQSNNELSVTGFPIESSECQKVRGVICYTLLNNPRLAAHEEIGFLSFADWLVPEEKKRYRVHILASLQNNMRNSASFKKLCRACLGCHQSDAIN